MNLSFNLNATTTAGLDIGKSSTKLVVLKTKKGDVQLVKKAIFHNREEGLMDDVEVIDHLQGWIREQHADSIETRIGLPQYMAMSQISDFPIAGEGQLSEMVEYETKQLAGLTDEVFVHDYIRLNPFSNYENPVLMGVCRDSIVENRIDLIEPAHISLEAIHMDGQALGDAYIHNMPAEDAEKLVLLIDIGGENTTLALVQEGQLIYVGSFLFGGDFFNEALAKKYGVNAADAERMKFDGSLDMEGEEDSLLLVEARTFALELGVALENSAVYDPLTNTPPLHKIYVSGGGSLFDGFGDYIADHFQTEVAPLPVADLDGDADAAFYNIAYGLALQGALESSGHQTISLTPEEVAYTSLRRKRRLLPVLSLVLLAVICSGYIGVNFITLQLQHAQLSKDAARLAECKKIATPLESNMKKISMFDQMLMPFAARGNRNTKVIAALHEVSKARKEECWFYYVSDPLTFANREETYEVLEKDPEVKAQEDDSLFNVFISSQKNEPSDRLCIMARSVRPLEGLVFAGFVPLDNNDRMRNIRDMRQQLADSPVFEKVDLLTEVTEIEAMARQPWMPFGMNPFQLGCRFANQEFSPETIGKPKK